MAATWCAIPAAGFSPRDCVVQVALQPTGAAVGVRAALRLREGEEVRAATLTTPSRSVEYILHTAQKCLLHHVVML